MAGPSVVLAQRLTQQLGLQVTIAPEAAPTRRSRFTWRLSWSDGPSERDMRREVARHRGPGTIAADEVFYDRDVSEQGLTVGILTWLEEHPHAGPADAVCARFEKAGNFASYPEFADSAAQRRARALLATGWSPRDMLTPRGGAFDTTLAAGGWEGLAVWLDTLNEEGSSGGDVVHLPSSGVGQGRIG